MRGKHNKIPHEYNSKIAYTKVSVNGLRTKSLHTKFSVLTSEKKEKERERRGIIGGYKSMV